MRLGGLLLKRVRERDLAECVALNDASAAIHCEQSPVGHTAVGRSHMGHTLAQLEDETRGGVYARVSGQTCDDMPVSLVVIGGGSFIPYPLP